jgi:hypothetical protein
MSERQSDFELLREFARHGDQTAFANVVRRHLDLVYATALRKVEDPGATEEVAQNVFGALGRKAWQFAPDDSLPAWLYRATLLEAREWLRCLPPSPIRQAMKQIFIISVILVSQQGVTLQLYLALIAAVLLQLATGQRPTKRMLELIQMYQLGWASLEELMSGLQRETLKAQRRKNKQS